MANPDFHKVELELPTGWFSAYDMECIYPMLIDSKKDDVYLEIGVDRGRSLAFARKYFRGDVFGIDIIDNGGSEVKGANFICSDANKVDWGLPINVLFIDGNHDYDWVKRDWEKYSPSVVKGGWVFFHDADETSPGVLKLTKEIGKVKYSPMQRCSMAWRKI